MEIKNKQILPILEGIKKIEGLKLGGIKTKIILKNKKSLTEAYQELEEVKKKLIEQYEGVQLEDGSFKFSEENTILVNKEWINLHESLSGIILIKINSAELDQFNDLTLEQMEILDLMSE